MMALCLTKNIMSDILNLSSMNYTSKHAIMGMMSARYIPFSNWGGYIKNKNEVVLFDPSLINDYNNYEKISLHYLAEMPSNVNITSKYKSDMLVSFFNEEFFKLGGWEYREIREARNKYNKIVTVEHSIKDIGVIVNFIREWNKKRGDERYGWQLHSGYDVSFFERFYEQEKDNLWANFFYIDGNFVGYSIISKNGEEECYNYLIRKNSVELRNLCLYIDYKSFEKIWLEKQSEFHINWGCSSGSLLKYKKKFPILCCVKRYFVKVKNEPKIIRQNELFESISN